MAEEYLTKEFMVEKMAEDLCIDLQENRAFHDAEQEETYIDVEAAAGQER